MRLAPLLSTFVFIALLAPDGTSQDSKGVADQIMRVVRNQQTEDGGYGQGFEDTCRVLDAMRRSPRRYTELDGPFFRLAARSVAAVDPSGLDLEQNAWQVLALAGCVTSDMRAALDRSRDTLAARDGAWTDATALLALRSHPPQDARWPADLPAGADAGLACLIADDPQSVPAPPIDDVDTWMSWARPARLRGITPDAFPELPTPDPSAALDRQLRDLGLTILVHGLKRADGPPPGEEDPRPPKVATPGTQPEVLAAALDYLDSRQEGGTFGLELPGWSGPEPGITAMCLSATIHTAKTLGQERPDWVDEGLDYLRGLQRPDGAIMDYGLAVYTTSVALEALLDGGRPEDRDAVAAARDFLIAMQADEDRGYDSVDDPHYGGIGYGGDERPDLSNTQMALEAASRAGLPEDSDFVAKAMLFLERNQNLAEVNTETWPRAGGGTILAGNDGGATYMPGSSPAGEDEVSSSTYRARSYGSMTYALTKSYLLCGLDLDDRRVDAALRWILDHYTLEVNPGFADAASGKDGLYYYYLALARTLSMLPDSRVTGADGARIPWRSDLEERLASDQRTDGSWFNEHAPRWYEGAPTLCTAYALLALEAAGRDSRQG